MKTIQKNLSNFSPNYPMDKLCNPNQTLFLDIETTGFHARSSSLYLIGCIYYADQTYQSIQWISENYEDELNLLKAFSDFAKSYFTLIHFNGNTFDVPYLSEKMKQYDIDFSFEQFEGIDLYKRLSPYKHFLKLTDCKQQTLEALLHNNRPDNTNGGDLIPVYHEYVLSHDDSKLELLLAHNESDIKGLVDICSLLSVHDLLYEPIKVVKVQANYYKDVNGTPCPEMIMDMKLPTPLPIDITFRANDCYFRGEGNKGNIRVPIYEEEMKYFYSNYKDYYYLPVEDIAIHKTVAAYVDKDFKETAHSYNCYTKKQSSFLPEWDTLFTPFFKRDYQSKELFFELTPEFKTQRESFNAYAQHILQTMVTASKTNMNK